VGDGATSDHFLCLRQERQDVLFEKLLRLDRIGLGPVDIKLLRRVVESRIEVRSGFGSRNVLGHARVVFLFGLINRKLDSSHVLGINLARGVCGLLIPQLRLLQGSRVKRNEVVQDHSGKLGFLGCGAALGVP
jgi:hypothetical protein